MIRFKKDNGSEYPEWNKEKWGSIGQFLKSGNLSKNDLTKEGTPCILYGELYTKYNEVANTIYSRTNSPCGVFSKKGDVIIPKSGETPEDISTATCIPYDEVALGGDLIIFRSDRILGTYLSYLIANKKKWEIAKIAQGKTIVHINEKSLSKIEIEFPCIEEQQKIADFLSSVDDLIQTQEDKIAVLEEQKKGIMQKLFNREVRFKADDGSEYPEWEERRLESLCYNIKSGKTKCIEEDGGYILYGSTGMIGKTNNIEYDGEYILVARVGANAGTVTLRKGKFGVSDNTLIVDNKENVDTKFLRFLLQNYNLKKLIFGSGQPLVTSGQLKKIEIQIPVKEEQNKMADCLSAYDEAIQIKKDKLEVWKEIKKGLLQQMFV